MESKINNNVKNTSILKKLKNFFKVDSENFSKTKEKKRKKVKSQPLTKKNIEKLQRDIRLKEQNDIRNKEKQESFQTITKENQLIIIQEEKGSASGSYSYKQKLFANKKNSENSFVSSIESKSNKKINEKFL